MSRPALTPAFDTRQGTNWVIYEKVAQTCTYTKWHVRYTRGRDVKEAFTPRSCHRFLHVKRSAMTRAFLPRWPVEPGTTISPPSPRLLHSIREFGIRQARKLRNPWCISAFLNCLSWAGSSFLKSRGIQIGLEKAVEIGIWQVDLFVAEQAKLFH